ncbi:MAG: hypothetical protein KGI70_00620 [Patescibacteria group bacterium]|nr:hypothetical protein [Patescibacteria group bacterium]
MLFFERLKQRWRSVVAVDLSQFSPHVQAAIKAIDLPANVLERAKNGFKWLEENAPPGWYLEMVSIFEGKVRSTVKTCWNDQNPLALAFRRVAEFAGGDGRVTWATVAPHFGFGSVNPSSYDAQRLGFLEMKHYAPENVLIDESIDSKFLDQAWAEVLQNYCERIGQPVEKKFVTLHDGFFYKPSGSRKKLRVA